MKKKKMKQKKLTTAQGIAIGFLGFILIGALLLTLPIMSKSGTATNFLDALFTATSAVCVTGLTTLNTAEHWSVEGQTVILTLIEIGGLGFMMMPVLFFAVAKRRKVSLSTRMLVKEALNMEHMSGVVALMMYILKLSFVIQFAGAVALSAVFVPKLGWAKGIWYSIFHSVSSFCNAGFDLLGDSLAQDQGNIYLLLVISFLIIAGGLGFFVWRDLLLYRNNHRLSLHTKIALSVTGALLVVGFCVFLLTEQNAAFLAEGEGPFARLANTFFMSVTPRTAGYYSINYMQMSHAGLVMTMFLMYIGGTSGSTAGGLKTTTFGVLLIQMRSMFKGRTRAEFSGRTIKTTAVFRAFTLFFLTLTLCVISIMILSVTETIPATSGIEYVAFEVFSAFGTVGLTMGLTPNLTIFGKLLIITLMYIGRVGVLTVGFSLITRARKTEASYKYPEESVIIG
ncbi:MAG: TrkH family potassium uptake protein [Enterococcus sp.]